MQYVETIFINGVLGRLDFYFTVLFTQLVATGHFILKMIDKTFVILVNIGNLLFNFRRP